MNAGLRGVTVCSSAFAWKRCRRGLSTSPSSSRIFAREGLGNPASSSVEQHEEACCASHEKDAKQINRRQVMSRTGVAFVSATVLPTTQGLATREALATTDEPGERPEDGSCRRVSRRYLSDLMARWNFGVMDMHLLSLST